MSFPLSQSFLLTKTSRLNIRTEYISGKAVVKMFDFPSFFLQAAEFLDIPDLFAILTQKSTEDSVDRKKLVLGLEDLCLSDGVFSDILFKLEDGTCAAHKPILMARFV